MRPNFVKVNYCIESREILTLATTWENLEGEDVQNRPPQNTPLWHIEFTRRQLRKSRDEKSSLSFFFLSKIRFISSCLSRTRMKE